jgi:uncharacterized protein
VTERTLIRQISFVHGTAAMIPTSGQCFDLMEKYVMLDNIRAHSVVVEQVASLIARCLRQAGENLVLEKVTAGALMHDIAKTLCLRTGENHAVKGREICVDHRCFEIADIVAEHIVLAEYDPHDGVREKEIVYYADKRVNHDVVVSLEQRLEYLLDHYGKNQDSLQNLIRENFSLCKEVEKKIFSRLTFRPEDVAVLIGQQVTETREAG